MNSTSQKLTVLLIEDNASDVFLTLRELKKHWVAVNHLLIESIEQLSDALKSDWDIILCDFNLPGFDGMTALRIIRESGNQTPFILVSSEVPEEVATLMMRLGANDYVMKNNLSRLAPAILRELKHRETQLEEAESNSKEKTGKSTTRTTSNKLLSPIVPDEKKNVTERQKAIVNILFVAEFIRKHQSSVLEKENLTMPQLNVLRILRRIFPESITITGIKEEMIYKTVDLSRMIDKMNKDGLVNSVKNKAAKEVAITVRGWDALNAVDKYDEEMFLPAKYLSEENATQINVALQGTLHLIKFP